MHIKSVNIGSAFKITLQYSFLVWQGLPTRGDESESNYVQLLKLRGEDDARAHDWLQRKTDKYTSPEMQTKRIQFMAFKVLREIVSFLNSCYSILHGYDGRDH